MTLSADLLLHAYSVGVFPMAETSDNPEIFWVDPKRRGILPLDGFHMSRSLRRHIRRTAYQVTVNRDFQAVVTACADREETWINDEIHKRYIELHEMGHAHSLEIWQDGVLSGGIYGVTVGAAFFGESMFSRRTNASKLALAYLVDRLNQTGFTLCDTQFLTTHLASLGGIEISRAAYRRRLFEAVQEQKCFTTAELPTAQELLQRNTQMS
ncbi:leucyl/phenylalanyl-tRNA--protein transferase [Parasedimentitalea huanghaiensis]|uniref:Leucyl/phenylalanyl-tRNA--protein transferase n=1 Tax=Parasedimentitalea huanghaiensis TaxID=2682100 RepID=A0A6L6WIX5_9RHOB|nr:leucyl/phenylalanyl-tRNA--protein transferase [Zongyanglinia huanghaiensis]MVO17440.1 leucyl/phenylalanyl-tRNA--protein transferase [Zongyanglinia huanghaiensis]